jgi:hypothetical protein
VSAHIVTRLREQNRKLREYAEHKDGCAELLATNELRVPCDCGLAALLAETED